MMPNNNCLCAFC